MNINFLRLSAIALLLSSCFYSCDKKDDPHEDPIIGGNYFVFAQNTDGSTLSTSFSKTPEGEIDVAGSTSVQVGSGSAMNSVVHKGTLYTKFSTNGTAGLHKYNTDAHGKLSLLGTIAGVGNFCIVSDTKGYYFDDTRARMKIQIFNPSSMQRTGEIDLSSLTKGQAYEVTGGRLLIPKEGKLYADIRYAKGSNFLTNPDVFSKGYLAVINTETDQYEKTIEREGVSGGLGYNGGLGFWNIDEQGHLYIASIGKLITAPGEKHGSALYRINKGSSDFDPSFRIDMEQYRSNALLLTMRVFNGKLYTPIPNTDYAPDFSNFIGQDIYEWNIIDLQTKKATKIEGYPIANLSAWDYPMFIDGKIYSRASNNQGVNGYYEITGNRARSAFQVKTGGVVGTFLKIEK